MLATFDGPARAVRCACTIRDAVSPLGLAVRAGVHAGEAAFRSGDVVGPAVEVNAAMARIAEPGEVLVSGTVTDLVAGSGLQFAERKTMPFERVPGHGRLFTAQ